LNAKVTVDGREIAGRKVYSPTLGGTLPAGRPTLLMTFTPAESRYGMQSKTLPITVFPAPNSSGPKPLTAEDLNAVLHGINNGRLPNGESDGITAAIQTSIIALGRGSCSLFITSWLKKREVFATPIVFLVWMRINSKLSYSIQIDSYSVEISASAGGPWISTQFLPLEGTIYYTLDNSLNDRNTEAFREALGSISSGMAMSLRLGGIYDFSTTDDDNYVKRVSSVKRVTLEDQLKTGLMPHGMSQGWTAFNPSAAQRALLMVNPSRIFFRIRLDTTAGNFTQYGEFHSLVGSPNAVPDSGIATMVKFGDFSTSLKGQELVYFGP